MKKSEFLPYRVQTRIDYEEKLERARELAKAERKVLAEMDKHYQGSSTDQSVNSNCKELNSYMELS